LVASAADLVSSVIVVSSGGGGEDVDGEEEVAFESVLVASEQNSILVQRWWQQGSQWAMVRMHIIVFFLIFDLVLVAFSQGFFGVDVTGFVSVVRWFLIWCVLVDLGVFVGKGSGNRGKACMLREMYALMWGVGTVVRRTHGPMVCSFTRDSSESVMRFRVAGLGIGWG
jgi:hypothetical protein